MTQIKRYALYGEQKELKQHSKGSLVLFSDHEKELVKERGEVINEKNKQFEEWKLEAKQKLKNHFGKIVENEIIDEVFGK